MRIRNMIVVLMALFMAIPMHSASAQTDLCPRLKVCVYKSTSLGSRESIENRGFRVWSVDSSVGNGWMSAQVVGRTGRRYFRTEDRSGLQMYTGVAPSANSAMSIPFRKDEPVASRSEPAIVNVPGPTVYVDRPIPGPTVYVDVDKEVPVEHERGWWSRNWGYPVVGLLLTGAGIGLAHLNVKVSQCTSVHSTPCPAK